LLTHPTLSLDIGY